MKNSFLKCISPLVVMAFAERCNGQLNATNATDMNMTATDGNMTLTDDFYYSPADIADCQAAVAELNTDLFLAAANADYVSNITEACYDVGDNSDACTVDIGFAGASVQLDATTLPQYDQLQVACQLAGGKFCTMVGTASGSISLLGGLFSYDIDMTLEGVANCIPVECGPNEIDEQGDFASIYSFVFELLQISADDVAVTSDIQCST